MRLRSWSTFDLDDLWLVVRVGESLLWLDRFDVDLGVSGRTVTLLDLLLSSFFARRLEDDRFNSVLILILVFPSFTFSVVFSPLSSTVLPLRECWSTLVKGGLGGAF